MIQRVQSLFLAVVVLCGVSFLIYPYANSLPITETSNITLMPTRASGFNTIFYIGVILNMISIVGTFITIFLFKNRKLQIKLIFLLIIVNFLLLGALYISNSNAQNNLSAVITPFIAIVAAYMAIRYIKKDEELVRSADRIR